MRKGLRSLKMYDLWSVMSLWLGIAQADRADDQLDQPVQVVYDALFSPKALELLDQPVQVEA